MYISALVQPHKSAQNAIPLSMSLPWSHLTKKNLRVTHQLQDEIWQVEMHGLHSHCEVVLPGLMYCMGFYGNHHADVAGDEKGST